MSDDDEPEPQEPKLPRWQWTVPVPADDGPLDPLRGLGSWKGPKDKRGWPELG